MPSTVTPKPYPTSVIKAGPKIRINFQAKVAKKKLTLFGATYLFSRTTQATDSHTNIFVNLVSVPPKAVNV